MWDAANEEGELREAGLPTEGKGLSTLSPDEREFVEGLQREAQQAWDEARAMGMVEGEGKESYVPRMVVGMAQSGHYEKARYSDEKMGGSSEYGRGFRTTTGSTRHRKYRTAEETEAAMKKKFGEHAQIARDIATLPLATAKLRKAVGARGLINKLKSMGNEYGAVLVAEGKEPNFFTIDHPAFYTWKPRLRKNEEGKWEKVLYDDGSTVFDKVPLFIHNDFRGPLTAVIGKMTGKIYNAMMTIREKAMVAIMYSPVIHNLVEYSRALPTMPGKVLTFKVYRVGGVAKEDYKLMSEAMEVGGLAPIGSRFAFDQEVSSILELPNVVPGRSWTAKALGYLGEKIFDLDSGTKIRRWVDVAGNFWHNTLLWDQVAKLQAGIYVITRDHLIKKGYDRATAVRMAAHLANRYAGSLPLEAMSTEARKVANLVFFSRSFTFGNLGVIKDMVTGLPKDLQAQIMRDAGPGELGRIKSFGRKKAQMAFMLDIAIGLVSTTLLASAINVLLRDKNFLVKSCRATFADFTRW